MALCARAIEIRDAPKCSTIKAKITIAIRSIRRDCFLRIVAAYVGAGWRVPKETKQDGRSIVTAPARVNSADVPGQAAPLLGACRRGRDYAVSTSGWPRVITTVCSK
jgi:hypothetical protein